MKIQSFINEKMLSAQYEFDPSVSQWIGWIEKFPGVYAQGKTVEDVRLILAEMVEEFVLSNIHDHIPVQGFSFTQKVTYA